MANIDLIMLDIAIKSGFITKDLSKVEEATLKKSIITANKIYLLIKKSGEAGVTCEQIEKRIKINGQTVQVFLRKFEASKLIAISNEKSGLPGGPKRIYYAA